jgi:hypothetical protein
VLPGRVGSLLGKVCGCARFDTNRPRSTNSLNLETLQTGCLFHPALPVTELRKPEVALLHPVGLS